MFSQYIAKLTSFSCFITTFTAALVESDLVGDEKLEHCRDKACVLASWNSGAWHSSVWVPRYYGECSRSCGAKSENQSFLRNRTIALVGDRQGLYYAQSLKENFGNCSLLREAERCSESETFFLLSGLHRHGSEGCTHCRECVSQEYLCEDDVRLIYIAMEHPLDFRIACDEYLTTQEAIVKGYLQRAAPDYVLFNTGLLNTANYPRMQPVTAPHSEIEKWQAVLRRRASHSWHNGDTQAYYQAGLSQLVGLLQTHLPASQLLWIRTSAPKQATADHQLKEGSADHHALPSRDRVAVLNELADGIMAEDGIPSVDAWAMSVNISADAYEDEVDLSSAFYQTVMDAVLAYFHVLERSADAA